MTCSRAYVTSPYAIAVDFIRRLDKAVKVERIKAAARDKEIRRMSRIRSRQIENSHDAMVCWLDNNPARLAYLRAVSNTL